MQSVSIKSLWGEEYEIQGHKLSLRSENPEFIYLTVSREGKTDGSHQTANKIECFSITKDQLYALTKLLNHAISDSESKGHWPKQLVMRGRQADGSNEGAV